MIRTARLNRLIRLSDLIDAAFSRAFYRDDFKRCGDLIRRERAVARAVTVEARRARRVGAR